MDYEQKSCTPGPAPVPLKNFLFVTLGAASMCWNPRPSYQVFDSSEAAKLGDELWQRIEKEIAVARSHRAEEVYDRTQKQIRSLEAAEKLFQAFWDSSRKMAGFEPEDRDTYRAAMENLQEGIKHSKSLI